MTDDTVPTTSSPAPTVRPRHTSLDPSVVFRIALLLAVSPIVVSAIHNGLIGWFPTGDAALTTVRVDDVFSAHPPLTGLPASTSTSAAEHYHFPGALHLYLVALPVQFLGIRWGLLLGMGALNTAWVVTALWLIRRRVGYRAATLACLFVATLLWGLGSQIIVDVTPLQVGLLPFLTLLAAAWSVADGDAKGWPCLAAAGNYLVLNQLIYSLVAPLVGAISCLLWLGWHRQNRAETERWQDERVRQRRHFAAAVLVTAVVWIPPVVEQFFSSDGNLAKLLRAATSSQTSPIPLEPRTVMDSLGVVLAPITVWPFWLRDSLADPPLDSSGPTTAFAIAAMGTVVVVSALVAVTLSARRRGDRTMVSAVLIATAAWFAWLLSAQLNPDTSFRYRSVYFHGLWPLSMFVWLVIALGVVRSRRFSHGRIRRAPALAVIVMATLVVAGLSVPIADFGSGTEPSSIPLARDLRHVVHADVPDGPPVLVVSSNFESRSLLPVTLLALQERGIPFRVRGGWDTTIYGEHRRFHKDPLNASRQLLLATHAQPDKKQFLLAHLRDDPLPPAERKRIRGHLDRWIRSATTIEIPESADMDEEWRADANKAIANLLATARGRGVSILDDPAFVAIASVFDPAEVHEMLPVPGLDGDEIHRWMHDEFQTTAGLWVYLMPLESPSTTKSRR